MTIGQHTTLNLRHTVDLDDALQAVAELNQLDDPTGLNAEYLRGQVELVGILFGGDMEASSAAIAALLNVSEASFLRG